MITLKATLAACPGLPGSSSIGGRKLRVPAVAAPKQHRGFDRRRPCPRSLGHPVVRCRARGLLGLASAHRWRFWATSPPNGGFKASTHCSRQAPQPLRAQSGVGVRCLSLASTRTRVEVRSPSVHANWTGLAAAGSKCAVQPAIGSE